MIIDCLIDYHVLCFQAVAIGCDLETSSVESLYSHNSRRCTATSILRGKHSNII